MSVRQQIAASPVKSARSVRLARAGWYVCAAIALGILILSIWVQMTAGTGALHNRQVTSSLPHTLNHVTLIIRMSAALLSLILASIVFLKRPSDRMALFLSYFLLVYGVVMGGPLAFLEPLVPGINTLTWRVIQPLLFAPLLFIFLSTFPNGWFVPLWTKRLAVLSFLYAPLSVLLLNKSVFGASKVMAAIGALVWFAFIFVGLYAQAYRYWRVSDPTERQQIKWVFYGFTLALLFALLTTSQDIGLRLLAFETPRLPSDLGWALFIAALPLTLTFAVMRYRLYDIDIIINRTLVYSTLTASVVGIYILAVGVLSMALQAQGNPIIALLATGLVAVLFQPLREHLQGAVNRFFYGQRDDPLRALSRLGQRLEATIAPEIVLPTLVATIRQTLKLPYVAISLHSGDEFRIAGESGENAGDAIRIPLNYQGQTVGQLIASPREPYESFHHADRRLLENIAHQAGATVYAVQLTQDLRQSRVRLVTAREEERRRLRRDLHDGLGPVLASQGLKMAAASQLVHDYPDKAQHLLEELTAQNEATVAEIRRLVYELRPAALDDLGLVGAVRDYASALKSGSQILPRPQVDVQAPVDGLPSLPAAIEVAAYRISTEALTNIAHHAHARRAAVSFALYSVNHLNKLRLEIIDDGIGLPEDHQCGIGLISMRERAEEVGGTFLIESPTDHGTRVVAELPLAEAK